MKFRSTVLILVGACLVGANANGGAARKKKEVKGQVVFSPAEITSSNAGPEDKAAPVAAITSSWQCYLNQDLKGYTAMLAADVTRMSERSSGVQQGKDAVAAGMAAEWETFERPEGVISENMTIRRAEFVVNQQPSATAATAVYWVDVSGGARWGYSDEGLVFQAFTRINDQWKITHQIDAWSLDHDLSEEKPGKGRAFTFDYVYPVADLKRAVNFYKPFLGEPESMTAQRAGYNLKGVRFFLDTANLDGHALVQKGLPCGYAILYVDDVVAERDRLKKSGVQFLAGTDTAAKTRGPDSYVIGLDPSANVFVLMQRNFTAANAPAAPEPAGFRGENPCVRAAGKIAAAWLKMDAPVLSAYYGAKGRWFDNTRLKTRGMEKGQAAIAAALPSLYWPRYDRTPGSLIATMQASSVHVRAVGSRTIVSYEMKLAGTGVHPFQETSLVTHVFDNASSVANTFIVANNRPKAMVLELDYTGYPVVDLKTAERFYTGVLRLGNPYSDSAYRGYWSDFAVFGIYTARPQRDGGLPRAKQANGYVSFWVHSAEAAYAYLKQRGAMFPRIPAISSNSGVDKELGYIQVAGTDSEGGLVIFTEYTGRRR